MIKITCTKIVKNVSTPFMIFFVNFVNTERKQKLQKMYKHQNILHKFTLIQVLACQNLYTYITLKQMLSYYFFTICSIKTS